MSDRSNHFFVRLFMVVIGIVAISVCANECEDCIKRGNTYFIVNGECENQCVERTKIPSTGWKQKLYRSIAKNSSDCYNVQYCTKTGDVTDGSFEDGKWIVKKSSFQENPICNAQCNDGSSNFPVGAEGETFLLFGASNILEWFYQGVEMPNQLIPTGTTHLSLFAATVAAESNTTQKLVVSIDSTMLLYIDNGMWDQFHEYYQNIDVDIRPFGDGNAHTIEIMYYVEASNDTAAFVVDYLRFIKDFTLEGNSKNFKWPKYNFCGGGCRQELLQDGKCHEQCNILACNYDNSHCEKDLYRTEHCYNGANPVSVSDAVVCPEYSSNSCCGNRYDFALIEQRLNAFKNSGCHVSDHCMDNIQKAICAYCSPENNNFILNGSVQFSKYFRDGLFSSCDNSFVKVQGACVEISQHYKNAEAFLEVFGQLSADESHCFDVLAYDPTMMIIIISCSVAGGVILIAVIITLSIVCYIQQKKKRESDSAITEMITVNPEDIQPVSTMSGYPVVDVVQEQPEPKHDESLSSVTYLQAF